MIAAAEPRAVATWGVTPLLEEDWEADYSDICDLALRDGRIEVAEAYRANSGDGWRSFRGRHGTYGFDFDWEKHWEAERCRSAEAKRYEAERQAREAARRHERQVAAKLEADQQWWEVGLGQGERERLAKLDRAKRAAELAKLRTDREWQRPPPVFRQPPVEPWFLPDRALTQNDLQEIACYALSYLAAAMRATQPGLSHVGTYMRHVLCERTADAIAGALYPLAKSLPPTARLSAVPLPMSDGVAGVTLALSVGAIHLALPIDTQKVVMAFTYDT